MCTAISFQNCDFYFGRTLDHDTTWGEEVVVTPRHFPLMGQPSHYAILGMAHVEADHPLYYDGINERGLAMAGLNFAGNAVYAEAAPEMRSVPHYDLIAHILGCCAGVQEAREELSRIRVTGEAFSEALPPARLHWMIADREEAIVVEITEEGLEIHGNPVGVLTNNPPFPQQLFSLNNYQHLSPENPQNLAFPNFDAELYSRGMGAMGLPGDWSSRSRFVRAAFLRGNAPVCAREGEAVTQFFHWMDSVAQPRGCCVVEDGSYEITVYTSCCNATRGIYYYTTYENRQITAVDMHRCDLDSKTLIRYPLIKDQSVHWGN